MPSSPLSSTGPSNEITDGKVTYLPLPDGKASATDASLQITRLGLLRAVEVTLREINENNKRIGPLVPFLLASYSASFLAESGALASSEKNPWLSPMAPLYIVCLVTNTAFNAKTFQDIFKNISCNNALRELAICLFSILPGAILLLPVVLDSIKEDAVRNNAWLRLYVWTSALLCCIPYGHAMMNDLFNSCDSKREGGNTPLHTNLIINEILNAENSDNENNPLNEIINLSVDSSLTEPNTHSRWLDAGFIFFATAQTIMYSVNASIEFVRQYTPWTALENPVELYSSVIAGCLLGFFTNTYIILKSRPDFIEQAKTIIDKKLSRNECYVLAFVLFSGSGSFPVSKKISEYLQIENMGVNQWVKELFDKSLMILLCIGVAFFNGPFALRSVRVYEVERALHRLLDDNLKDPSNGPLGEEGDDLRTPLHDAGSEENQLDRNRSIPSIFLKRKHDLETVMNGLLKNPEEKTINMLKASIRIKCE